MQIGILALAIGLGLVVSFLFTEAIGLAAGGFVVPGYIALQLGDYRLILRTFIIALMTFGGLKLVSRILLVYGRRSLVLAVLLGFSLNILVSQLPKLLAPRMDSITGFLTHYRLDTVGFYLNDANLWLSENALHLIGFIIPGLLAYWMSRQGIVRTLAATIIAAVLVRLSMILLNRGVPFEAPFI